jgi:hypothetical protein
MIDAKRGWEDREGRKKIGEIRPTDEGDAIDKRVVCCASTWVSESTAGSTIKNSTEGHALLGINLTTL